MKKAFVIFVLFFLFIGLVGVLFTRWWHARTSNLHFPTIVMTPVISSTSLGKLLEHMSPLTTNEKTVELASHDIHVSGLIRYTKEGMATSYTVFAVVADAKPSYLHVWVTMGGKEKDVGELHEGKGGLLLDGVLQTETLPVGVNIAPLVSGKKGISILDGELPS